MKGKRIIIPFLMQKQILHQLHSNHMGIKKMLLLTHESVYQINIKTDIENMVKQCATNMEYQQTQPCEKMIPYEMLHKHWEVLGANIFTIKSNTSLCIVEYYSRFSVVKKTNSLSADSQMRPVKISFAEFGLPQNSVIFMYKFFIIKI